MAEFDTIKKIIRLFTITLLALWAAQCLFSAQEGARVMSEHNQIVRVQELYSQGIKMQQSLRVFYMIHERLPEPDEYQDLECAHPFARCPFKEWQGAFYVREGQRWLAIEPLIDEEDKLHFRCRASELFETDSGWRPPLSCSVDARALPFDWPEDTADTSP